MKVTAFIRKTSAKNNVTDLARVYFRVRDIGGVDIKAASELSINPNHWSAERQGYKPRVALVSEEKKNALTGISSKSPTLLQGSTAVEWTGTGSRD